MSGGRDILHLLRQARQGDREALGALLHAYRNYLRLLARTGTYSLGGKVDPSDLVQDVMLKAGRDFGQFCGTSTGELAAWLRQILARSITDHARRAHAQRRAASRELSLDQLLNQSSHALDQMLACKGAPAEQLVERSEARLILADALAELPADYNEVIVLHDLQELSWDEIAQRMGRSKGSVRMLWARALKHLRPLIEAQLGESSDRQRQRPSDR